METPKKFISDIEYTVFYFFIVFKTYNCFHPKIGFEDCMCIANDTKVILIFGQNKDHWSLIIHMDYFGLKMYP